MSSIIKHTNVPDISSCPLCLEVTPKVELKHARQISGNFTQKLNVKPGPKSVTTDNATKVEVDKENLRMFVYVDFNLVAIQNDNPDPAVSVIASFLLVYELTDIDGLTEQHFSEFAKINGVFNAWPYWREYVQSATSRMGLPPLTIPVMCLYKPKKKKKRVSKTVINTQKNP